MEKMFESMGGDKLEEDAANILKELQQNLNSALDDLASQFAIRWVILRPETYSTVNIICILSLVWSHE